MVPVGGVVAFPGIDRGKAEELGVDSVVNLDHCLFKADLDAAIKDGDEAVLHRRFLRVLDGGVGEELDDAALDELRALVHPDVVVQPPAGQGSLFAAASEDADVVRVMDRKQERLAKGLGAGHRIVRGVAGSGKTLVLVHRARLMARALPSSKILVTCFTRSLASQLRSQLAEFDNVEVVHLHTLMTKAIRDAGRDLPKEHGRVDWDSVPAAALEAIRATHGQKYRAVMVDEAQDFDTSALEFCVELFESRDVDEQDLVVVADSAQNIFRRNFRWKDAGIKAQGRTRILSVNYRNTREILTFAHAFLTADPAIQVSDDPEFDDELTIIPAESAERTGPIPVVALARDVAGEIDAVIRQVKEWYSSRLRARSIAVLMADGKTDDRARRIMNALYAADIPTFWVTDPDEPGNRDEAGSTDQPVIVSTIHSAKGLEFPKVVVCGLGGRSDDSSEALVSARKLLYVGYTRAIDELSVVTTVDNVFRADLPG